MPGIFWAYKKSRKGFLRKMSRCFPGCFAFFLSGSRTGERDIFVPEKLSSFSRKIFQSCKTGLQITVSGTFPDHSETVSVNGIRIVLHAGKDIFDSRILSAFPGKEKPGNIFTNPFLCFQIFDVGVIFFQPVMGKFVGNGMFEFGIGEVGKNMDRVCPADDTGPFGKDTAGPGIHFLFCSGKDILFIKPGLTCTQGSGIFFLQEGGGGEGESDGMVCSDPQFVFQFPPDTDKI